MKVKGKYILAGASLLYTVAAFLFFVLAYSAHVHFQEQFQLFLFTGSYFKEVVSAPGGFADWLGRFLTQFSWWAAAGAAINALILLAVQQLCWKLSERKTPLCYVLSFVPSILCFGFLCDENAILGGAVALLIVLAAVLGVRRIGSEKLRSAATLVLVPVLYFLAGPLVAVFAVLSMRGGKPWLWIATAAVLAACLIVPGAFSLIPTTRFLYGLHYFRYPNIVPKLLWFAAAAAVIFVVVGWFRFKNLKHGASAFLGAVCFVALAVGGVYFIKSSSDFSDESIMAYDWMARNADWDGIYAAAVKEAPMSPMQAAYLNLAMAEKGILADKMFDFYQKGLGGLLPELQKDHFSALPTGEAYYNLGLANFAQRFYFEEQEAIPDNQLSIRCCKRIADCFIVNDEYAAAAKYVEMLRHTLVYHKWAKTLDTESEEYSRLRSMRVDGENFISVNHPYSEIFRLAFESNPENRLMFDYMMAILMLEKNLDGIVASFQRVEHSPVPKYYQQAVLLFLVNKMKSLEMCPDWVTRENAGQMVEFYKAYADKKDQKYMQKHFGKTLWYYMVYRNLEENQ